MGCKRKEKQLKNKHPRLEYSKTYASQDEAIVCPHVQTAAKHHNVSVLQLARLLAGGINILSAVVTLAAFL